MTADLVDLVTAAVVDRETRVRQGKVVSIQTSSITVNISGSSYSGIQVMDHVYPIVDEGVWMLDMGIGRWLAFGTNNPSHNGGAWNTTFVPVLGQGAATPNIAKSVVKSEWRYDGPMIEFECRLDPTGTGTAGEFLSATLPVPPVNSFYSNGNHFIYHGGFYYLGSMESFAGNTAVVFNVGGSSVWGFGPGVATGPGDQIRFTIRYRWAS